MSEQFRIYKKDVNNGMWPVQHFVPSHTTGKKTWVLFGHYDEFILYDCKFIVSEKINQTVSNKQQRTVDACIQGSDGGNITLSDMRHNLDIIKQYGVKVTYNPYKSSYHTVNSMDIFNKASTSNFPVILKKASAVHFPIVGRPTVLL